MKSEFWLKVSARKSPYPASPWVEDGLPKVSRNKPPCGADEVPIKVSVEIPDSYFEEPEYALTIKIPESPKPVMMHPELQSRIGQRIAEEMGVKVHLSVDQDQGVCLTCNNIGEIDHGVACPDCGASE